MREELDPKNISREMKARNIEETHKGVEAREEMNQEEGRERPPEEGTETHLEVDLIDKIEMRNRIDMEDRRKKMIEDTGRGHQVVIDTEEDS